MHLSRQFLFVAVGGVAGCSSDKPIAVLDTVTPPRSCIAHGPVVTPATATIFVGDTLRVKAQANTCLNPAAAADSFRWFVSDSIVARVDSLTGLVTGRSAGTTTVIARQNLDRTIQGAMVVRVDAR
jgi:uncharacterized protein YjdB